MRKQQQVIMKLRMEYGWSKSYTRAQQWAVKDIVKRLSAKHDVDWLARHLHRHYSPIYLRSPL